MAGTTELHAATVSITGLEQRQDLQGDRLGSGCTGAILTRLRKYPEQAALTPCPLHILAC